jgi:4-hydroxy-3-polyprenylbenzoate decarboxylase
MPISPTICPSTLTRASRTRCRMTRIGVKRNKTALHLSLPEPAPLFGQLKLVIAITGASGSLYAQRLLDHLDPAEHEIHVILSNYARQVLQEELPNGLQLTDGVRQHSLKSMNVPFASGSNPADAMVVIPCTMGTLGRIAHGVSDDVLLRTADVMLKERRRLILVPRETPLSLIHVRNMELLLLAGATLIPANPSFYARPQSVEAVVDTVVARVLDHLEIQNDAQPRWQAERE